MPTTEKPSNLFIKSVKAFIYLGLLLSSVTLIFSFTSLEKVRAQEVSFTIDEQYINAFIEEDGDVLFFDYQLYKADYLNGAEFTLDHIDYNLSQFEVGVAQEAGGAIEYFEESSSRQPQTYSTWDEEGYTRTRAYYPMEDESIYFVFIYRLDELITNYNDTAELLRQFGKNDFTTDVTIRIELPGLVEDPDAFRAWGYGAPQGEVSLTQENGQSVVYLEVPNRQSDQFVEGHILFPTSLTPLNNNQVDEEVMDDIINKAQATVEADALALQSQSRWVVLLALAGMIVAPVLGIVLLLYYRHLVEKLNPQPQHVPEYVYGLPEEITPGIMATRHFRRSPIEDDFAATLLHLVQKGYFKLEEVMPQKQGWFNKGQDTIRLTKLASESDIKKLLPHEKNVWDFFTLDEKDSITLEELDDLSKESTSFQTVQNTQWSQFKSKLQVAGERYLGESRKIKDRFNVLWTFALVISLSGLVVAFISLVIPNSYVYIPITPLVIGLVISFLISLGCLIATGIYKKRRPLLTTEQQYERDLWIGFSNMLKDIGNFKMREIASLPLWEEYLVYATSLGVADKVIDALEVEFSVDEIHQYGGMYSTLDNPFIVAHIISSQVDQSVRAATPAQSSDGHSGSNTGGFGGGFSSGSMGGSGGGTSSGGF